MRSSKDLRFREQTGRQDTRQLDQRILRKMVQLMVPLILTSFLQQLYNTADTLVLGHFGSSTAFAAAGVASSVMNLFLFLVIGACTGISVLFSRYYGAGDRAAFRNEHYLVFVFGLLFAAGLSLLGCGILSPLMQILRVPQALIPETRSYLFIVLLGLPAAYLYNMYSALLRSVGKPYSVLVILADTVTVNLVLDVFLVRNLQLGIAGAAAATVSAETLSAIASLLVTRLQLPDLMFTRADCRYDRARLLETLRLSAVTAVHQVSLYIGKLCIQGLVDQGGVAMVSAFTATTRIEGFANSFGDSGASAASVVMAQYVGMKKRREEKRSFVVSIRLLLAVGIVSGALMYLLAEPFSAFLMGTPDAASLAASVSYLHVIAPFYVLCFLGNAFVGSYDGLGKVKISLTGALGHMTLRIILSALLIGRMGLPAVALATGIGWILGCTFWSLFRKSVFRLPSPKAGSVAAHA